MSTPVPIPAPESDRLQVATHRAEWVLRVSVALLAFGLAAALLPIFNAYGEPSNLNSLLVIDHAADEDLAATIDRVSAIALLVLAVGILITRHARVLLPFVVLWLLVGAAYQIKHTVVDPELILPSSALRVLAPVALLLMMARPAGSAITPLRATTVEWVLRVAIAATFAGHGLEALFQHGHFVDLIIGSVDNVWNWRIAEPDARTLLAIIGSVDMVVAMLILVPGRRCALAAWLTFWGVVTAAARITFWGDLTHLDDTLVRLVHGGAPLALLVWWASLLPPRSSANAHPAGHAADPDAASAVSVSTDQRTDP